MTFKPNDKILCLCSQYAGERQQVEKGKLYCVKEFKPGIYGDFLILVGVPHTDVKNCDIGWIASSFKKLETVKKEK